MKPEASSAKKCRTRSRGRVPADAIAGSSKSSRPWGSKLQLPVQADGEEIEPSEAALAAEKLPGPSIRNTSTPTTLFGIGSILYLMLFCLEWIDFKAANINTDLVPKIVVYSSEKMEELITLVEEDRQRSDENRRYKTKPEGSMGGLSMRWHPLMVPRTDVVTRIVPVGVEEGMHNIMAVLEEHVMPMLIDAVVTVAAETNEANRGSVVEDLFRQSKDKMKKLQFCFGSKLYPGAVSMSPKFPAITYGGSSTSHSTLGGAGSGVSSRAPPSGRVLISELEADPLHVAATASHGVFSKRRQKICLIH